MKWMFTFFAACTVLSASAGDILTLTNAMVFEGKVKKIKGCEVVFEVEGDKYIIPVRDIFSLQFEDTEDKVYTDYLEVAQDDFSVCLNGQMDAQLYHGKEVGHFALGFLFGPFAMIGTALASPTPFNGRKTLALSQNKEQFTDTFYLSCYRKQAKRQLITSEALGWGAWILVALIIQ
jgi:hypothetical protein